MNLDFKAFLQTSIPTLISIFNAKEGVSRFSVENFLSHSGKTFRGGTLLFQKVCGIKKNILRIRGVGGGGEDHLKIFLSQYRKSW